MRTLHERREDAIEKIILATSGTPDAADRLDLILDHLEVWQLEELVEDFYPEEEVDMPPRNKPLPSMTSKAYADGAGIFCPACRSSSGITGDSEVDTDGSVARQKCSCGCGASWVDDYRLVGYYELEVPKEEVDA